MRLPVVVLQQGDSSLVCRTCGRWIEKSQGRMVGSFPYAGGGVAVIKKSGLLVRSWRRFVTAGDVRDESAGFTAA